MLCLNWHFRNENKDIHREMFKPKSKINPCKKGGAIEIYLSKNLEVEAPKVKFSSLTNSVLKALYDLKNENENIEIESADKCAAVVVWDREYYITEAEKQLGDEVYEEVSNDTAPLQKNHKCSHSKNKKTG